MLEELRKVIPSFLTRVDRPERGGAGAPTSPTPATATESVVARLTADDEPEPRPSVVLTDFDPEGEDKVLAAICYPHTTLPDDQLLSRVRRLGTDERQSLLDAYVGARENRRHKPGRAFERTQYRFDVLSDYGAFRDLQRHRMLTIEWQALTPHHGYETPDAVVEAGLGDRFDEAMERSAELFEDLEPEVPDAAGYAVALAYRIRFVHGDERPGGDPSPRAALLTPGPPGVPARRAGDAPTDRRAGRPPGDRGRDASRRPRHLRPRTAGLRAGGRGAPSRPPLSRPHGSGKSLTCPDPR